MKRAVFIKVTAVIITCTFALTLLMGIIYPFIESGGKADDEITDEEVWLQQKNDIPIEQLDKAGGAGNYMTISQKGNIDIGVNYVTPLTGDRDTLRFDIILGTHSVDLTKYKDIRKYVELRTDSGAVINKGFEWTLETSESHHISGVLKIKNSFGEKTIIGLDTKSFKLVFKNIGSVDERAHVYEGDNLI